MGTQASDHHSLLIAQVGHIHPRLNSQSHFPDFPTNCDLTHFQQGNSLYQNVFTSTAFVQTHHYKPNFAYPTTARIIDPEIPALPAITKASFIELSTSASKEVGLRLSSHRTLTTCQTRICSDTYRGVRDTRRTAGISCSTWKQTPVGCKLSTATACSSVPLEACLT